MPVLVACYNIGSRESEIFAARARGKSRRDHRISTFSDAFSASLLGVNVYYYEAVQLSNAAASSWQLVKPETARHDASFYIKINSRSI